MAAASPNADHPPPGRSSGEAFFVGPEGGARCPGVLVLHSWWGLTDWTKDFATRLADEGYTVLAPDLFEGVQPVTEAEGEVVLAGADALDAGIAPGLLPA